MPVIVEIIKPFLGPIKLGSMTPDAIHPFTNFTMDDKKELIIFKCDKKGERSDVYKAKEWRRDVDIKKLDSDEYERVATLNHGDSYFIEARLSGNSNLLRLIRFTQE